jgi:hypothetical protein
MAAPTIADLTAEVAQEVALLMADAGVYLTAPDGSTPAIAQGLRRGCKAVALTPADPLVLADSDVALLSTYAVERVIDEAKLFALKRARLYLYRAAQVEQEPVSPNVVASGWRLEQSRAISARISELKAICDVPYREPSSEFSVDHRPRFDPASRPSIIDACYPDDCGYGFGHGAC